MAVALICGHGLAPCNIRNTANTAMTQHARLDEVPIATHVHLRFISASQAIQAQGPFKNKNSNSIA